MRYWLWLLSVSVLGFWSVSTDAQRSSADPQVLALIDGLASPDVAVRTDAGRELLAMGPVALPLLLDAAAGPDTVVAERARELLSAPGPEAIESLGRAGGFNSFDHPRRRGEAAAAVARMGEAALPRILEIFTTYNPVRDDWAFSVGVLLKMNGLAVKPLLPLLKHPTRQVRHEAATLLAQLADPRSYEAVMEGLGSEDAWLRTECARALGRIGDPRASARLLAALHDTNWQVRQAAAAGLGELYEPRFLVPLARLARGDDELLVRDTASKVLMHYTKDPVAMRLGRRYVPRALSPRYRAAIQLRIALQLAATCALLLGTSLLVMGRKGARGWASLAWAALLAAVLGFVWGRVVEHVWGTVENALLVFFVPVVLLVGCGGAWLWVAGSRARVLWVAAAACFYLGYGVGWLALWGYLGA